MDNLRPLTSLRFFAAFMIVVHHLPLRFPDSDFVFPGTLIHGVSFFFVLSGFILTHVYASKPWPGYWRFIALRLARLWPMHVFVILLLISSVRIPGLFVSYDSVTFDGSGIFNRRFALALNVALVHAWSPFPAHMYSWNSPSWSISTEMGFYLAFPFLLLNIRNNWHYKLIGSALLVGVILSLMRFLPATGGLEEVARISAVSTNPLFRGFEFCLGMATWALWDRYFRRCAWSFVAWSAIELAVVAFTILWFLRLFEVTFTSTFLLPWSGGCGSCFVMAGLIAVLADGRGLFSKVLSTSPFVSLGNISYSVYMLHIFLLKVVSNYGLYTFGRTPYLAFVLATSSVTYLLIEKPARSFLVARLQKANASRG